MFLGEVKNSSNVLHYKSTHIYHSNSLLLLDTKVLQNYVKGEVSD